MQDAAEWGQRVRELFTVAQNGTWLQLEDVLCQYMEKLGGEYSATDAVLDTRDAEGFSLIHHAAAAGNVDVLRWLESSIGRKAIVEATTKAGDTVLHLAVRQGHREVVRFLLNLGADRYHLNAACLTPLHMALTADPATGILDLLVDGLEPHEALYTSGTVTGSFLTWLVLTNQIALFKQVVNMTEPRRLVADCCTSSLPCAVVAAAKVETAGVFLQYLLQRGVAPDVVAEAHDQQQTSVLSNLAQLNEPQFLLKLLAAMTSEATTRLCNQRDLSGATPYMSAATEEARTALEPFTLEEYRSAAIEDASTNESSAEAQLPPVTPRTISECERLKSEGNTRFAEKKYQAAEAAFDEAAELLRVEARTGRPYSELPENVHALISTVAANLSVTSLRLNKIPKAKQKAEIAIAHAPEWYKGYYRLAMALKAEGDYEEAAQQMYQCVLRNNEEDSLRYAGIPKTLPFRRELKACIEKARAVHQAAQAPSEQ